MTSTYSTEELVELIQDRGFITVFELIEPSQIVDEQLSQLWNHAAFALRDVQERIKSKTGVEI